MPTLKLTLAYDGTDYVGWQRQASGLSVQQLVEEALAPLVGATPAVAGAGRTDAGVHAVGQVASVRCAVGHDPATVQRALNARLPPAIRVLEAVLAPPAFHARFDATGKRYRYRMVVGQVVSPFDRWFVWHAPGRLDVAAMQRASRALVGRHDFASFQGAGSAVTHTVRTITALEVEEVGGELRVDVEGDGFLRHMVRAIVGTLAEVGTGGRRPESLAEVLAARDRRAAGDTAPARGLTLLAVRY